jgi:coenzyme F420-0:L-glutamate ligase/coenzyme F420-1:gamma-L-glutamate ligase
MSARLEIVGLAGIPEVAEGDDLAELLLAALSRSGETLREGDILVVSSKVVSKAGGLQVGAT